MMASTLLLAATVAAAAPSSDVTALTCSLDLADGSQYQMAGHFDAGGLQSNLVALTKVEGAFPPTAPGPIISTDGTANHRWTLDGGPKKFDASLTIYGSDVGVLILEKRTFVGRHHVRDLIGVGLCGVRSGQAGGKAS